MNNKACQGADTRPVRTTEHMQECRCCGLRVREDMADDPFFGFLASCVSYRHHKDRAEKGKEVRHE